MPFVYCFRVGAEDCFKVGRTKSDSKQRKDNVSVGSPHKLTLYREIQTEYASKLERFIHELLELQRADNGEFFYVTSSELDDAIEHALAFLSTALPLLDKAAKLQKTKPNDETLEPSAHDLELYNQLRDAQKELFFLKQKVILLQSQIKIAIGANLGIRGIASWRWQETARFNLTVFKAEQPEIYERYRRVSESRVFRIE